MEKFDDTHSFLCVYTADDNKLLGYVVNNHYTNEMYIETLTDIVQCGSGNIDMVLGDSQLKELVVNLTSTKIDEVYFREYDWAAMNLHHSECFQPDDDLS